MSTATKERDSSTWMAGGRDPAVAVDSRGLHVSNTEPRSPSGARRSPSGARGSLGEVLRRCDFFRIVGATSAAVVLSYSSCEIFPRSKWSRSLACVPADMFNMSSSSYSWGTSFGSGESDGSVRLAVDAPESRGLLRARGLNAPLSTTSDADDCESGSCRDIGDVGDRRLWKCLGCSGESSSKRWVAPGETAWGDGGTPWRAR
mmetsp:Transcript_23921/g.71400  ORF Transcript_23921/g.71400 Transcript_23921/m.71400 type:complete len:203 (-) Transcript_23921:625-1233(-)